MPTRSSRFSISLIILTFGATTYIAQSAPQSSVEEFKFGDYTFKMTNGGQVGQVWDGMKPVGTIYMVGTEQKFLPIVPEPEASSAKKAFEDWKASGKTGSQEPPKTPPSFLPDGSAIVPMQDGSVVSFTPTYIEINKPSGLAMLPGQPSITNIKFMLKAPGFGKEMFGNHTGIYQNGKEITFGGGFGGNGGRVGEKNRVVYLKPMVDGQVKTAMDMALNDPHKPDNALDYRAEFEKISKRVDYRF